MKTLDLSKTHIFHHITGNHPTREITREEIDDAEPCWLVAWQDGFDVYTVAVYGDGLCESDAMEAAEEFCPERGDCDYWQG